MTTYNTNEIATKENFDDITIGDIIIHEKVNLAGKPAGTNRYVVIDKNFTSRITITMLLGLQCAIGSIAKLLMDKNYRNKTKKILRCQNTEDLKTTILLIGESYGTYSFDFF